MRPKPASCAEPAAQVHLEALDVVAVGVQRPDALEPDVGHLDARARVGAAVDVDRERQVVLGQPGLELVDQVGARAPSSRRWRACRTRRRCRPSCCGGTATASSTSSPMPSSPATSVVDADRVDVEDDDLLLGRERARGPSRPPRRGRRARSGAVPDRRPTDRRGADVQVAVALQVHADVVAAAVDRAGSGAGPSISGAAEVLRLEHLAELLGAPVLDEELQPRLGAQPAVAVVAEDAR